MTNYKTLGAEQYLSDLASDTEMEQFENDVLVSVGFKSEDGEWKEAYLNSDPNEEFLSYQVDDFGINNDLRPEVEVHRSKVSAGTDLTNALQDFDPAYSTAIDSIDELEDVF